MGDNGEHSALAVPEPEPQPESALAETYDTDADRQLLCKSVREGWLKGAVPKYQAAMDCLERIVRIDSEASLSVRVKAAKVLLEASQHTAEVLAPRIVEQQQEQQQAQQLVVNVANPDGPLAKLRAQWAEKRDGDAA